MNTCRQCDRRGPKLSLILIQESGSTNAWWVECCEKCKQCRDNLHHKRDRKGPKPGEVIWLLIALVLLCIMLANGTIAAMLSNLLP